MPTSLLTSLAALALAAPAVCQTVLFEDDFDQGLQGWSTTASWHWIGPGDPCTQMIQPFPSARGAVRFGDANCTFNSFPFYGSLSMTSPVSLPVNAAEPTLSFWSYAASEGCNGWDNHYVYASTDGGTTWSWIGSACLTFVWNHVSIDLSAYSGQEVLLRFYFDAVDFWGNDGLGWIVDDVKVTTAACARENYCIAAPNSASASGAIMGHSGTKRIHVNDFVLTLEDGPPNQFAHFFYGPEATQNPVADGFLCVGAGNTGIVRLTPSGQINAAGRLERQLDFPSTLGSASAILPGSIWRFQCWYRDPVGGPHGSNFSDGLAVTFCP